MPSTEMRGCFMHYRNGGFPSLLAESKQHKTQPRRILYCFFLLLFHPLNEWNLGILRFLDSHCKNSLSQQYEMLC